MKSMSGAGVLVVDGQEIDVLYDLVEADASAQPAVVGQVFGEADALQHALHASHAILRLANGHAANIVLQNCESRGVADVRIEGAIDWD